MHRRRRRRRQQRDDDTNHPTRGGGTKSGHDKGDDDKDNHDDDHDNCNGSVDFLDESEQAAIIASLRNDLKQQQHAILQSFFYLCLATGIASLFVLCWDDLQIMTRAIGAPDHNEQRQSRSYHFEWWNHGNTSSNRTIGTRFMIWFQGAWSIVGQAISYQHATAAAGVATASSTSPPPSTSPPNSSLSWHHRAILLGYLLVAAVGWWHARDRPEVALLHQGLLAANVLTLAGAFLIRWDQADSQRSLDDLIAHQYRFKSL